jgi:hypothetical protein
VIGGDWNKRKLNLGRCAGTGMRGAPCTTRIQITTDGFRFYADAIEGVFGIDVDYAQLIEVYGMPNGAVRATVLAKSLTLRR